MTFEIAPSDDPRRVSVREWLQSHPNASGTDLATAGYVAPHWPKPYGLGADPVLQLIIDEELKAAGVRRPSNPIGIGWAGPTLLEAGTEDQQSKYLPGILSAQDIWCQLFSEPGAGSDLADLSTRAERDGDEWIINGQKVWTSLAHHARYGILIARTDPDLPKRKGISYFVCDMSTPGIEIRPLVEMTGVHNFNEVFLTDVRLPAENLVGEVNDGWRLAKVTLANERVSLSSGGALWGMGPDATDLLDVVRAAGGVADPVMRQRLATMFTHHEILRQIRMRTITAAIQGRQPGPEASVRKVLADEHGQEIMGLAKDLAGAGGMLTNAGPLGENVGLWHYGYLFSQALTIGGGTGDVQRNILGERVLGLPAEPDHETARTWAESHSQQRAGAAAAE
ncbi:MAG: acyl-CoA dehydrogenase family protein [Microthrixaceae bacterium]|nr:acyl-CoA dehydrogenase family protein [Microthrixaceae bacterium]